MHHAGAWPSAAKNVITVVREGTGEEEGVQERSLAEGGVSKSSKCAQHDTTQVLGQVAARLAAGRVDTKASPT